MNVQSRAVVDVLEMAPGRRAVLASAADAEVRLRAAVTDDEAAAGQEVAGLLVARRDLAGTGGDSDEDGRCHRDQDQKHSPHGFLHSLRSAALLNGRGRGRDHHVRDTVQGHVKGIDD